MGKFKNGASDSLLNAQRYKDKLGLDVYCILKYRVRHYKHRISQYEERQKGVKKPWKSSKF